MNELWVGIIGLISTVSGSILSWFLTRKKYTAEVTSNELQNLQASLVFYERIVQDNNKRLQFYIKLAESNRVEVYRLKSMVYRLLNDICLNPNCKDRQFLSEEQLKIILESATPEVDHYDEVHKKEEDDT